MMVGFFLLMLNAVVASSLAEKSEHDNKEYSIDDKLEPRKCGLVGPGYSSQTNVLRNMISYEMIGKVSLWGNITYVWKPNHM